MNVPPGFIINTKSYKNFLKTSQIKEKLLHILSNGYHAKDIIGISNRIKELYLRAQSTQEITEEIKIAYTKLVRKTSKNTSFSVRSSTDIEDSNCFSFAGQAESYLNIKTFKGIINYIKNCWISLYSPQALLNFLKMNKENKKISLIELKMAVIIQKMINSQKSGVLFTVNILNNDKNEMLINSTWGLGDTNTNNIFVPDMINLDKKQFKIVKIVIVKKEKMSLINSNRPLTGLSKIKQKLKEICSLNNHQLFQLYNLGLNIESVFNYPQDIEWAIEKDILYTLQSRPIITLRKI
ncbi:MAG: PEP/pyruvate-binding domain-containing protein [Candidatus Hodarchaeota archaeon]